MKKKELDNPAELFQTTSIFQLLSSNSKLKGTTISTIVNVSLIFGPEND